MVRAFNDPTVPHEEGGVDPHRDLAAMELELAFADLAILERRVERLEAELKGARAGERESRLRERDTLNRLKSELEQETPIREQELSADELRLLANFGFLTAKPLLILWNIGEEDATRAPEIEEELRQRHGRPGVGGRCSVRQAGDGAG